MKAKRTKFDRIVRRMPAKNAPLAMRRLFPALVLLDQRTAAPTLKSRVALAILQELQQRKQ